MAEKTKRERDKDDGNERKAEREAEREAKREADRDTSQKKVTERKRSKRAMIHSILYYGSIVVFSPLSHVTPIVHVKVHEASSDGFRSGTYPRHVRLYSDLRSHQFRVEFYTLVNV